MRIAYVINSLEGGGAALPVPMVTRLMRDAGHDVKLFALSMRNGLALPPMEADGLDWDCFEGGKAEHLGAFRWLNHSLSSFKPDLIWTSLTQATLIGQLVGAWQRTPVVSWQHNAFLKPANARLLKLTRGLSKWWVADSESVAALTHTRLGIPEDRLSVWPLFVANPNAPRTVAWQLGQVFRLGSLGRLHPNKGYDVLADALVILANQGFQAPVPFSVEICGEGAERPALEAAMARLPTDQLRLIGFTDQPLTFLSSLHAYVQPSRAEGLCIAAHEAMVAGLPAIVGAVGEMPYSVIEGETGYVVQPGNPVTLAAKLRTLLSAPDRASSMGDAARTRILKRFSATIFNDAGHACLNKIKGVVDAQ